MKTFRFLFTMLALAIGVGAPAIVNAQNTTDTAAKKPSRIQELTTKLSLTQDQQQKVTEIYKNETAQLKTLGQDATKQQKQTVFENTRQSINAILTPAQQETYNELLSEKVIAPKQTTPKPGSKTAR